jgi:RNA polymerase sigma-70 factor (ECF subfamily)
MRSAALDATWPATRPRLERLARRLLGCPYDADDVAQDAWLRAALSPTPARDPSGLLLAVARNLARDRLRARTPALLQAVGVDAADPSPCPERLAADREALRRLNAAIAALPPRCGEAFRLARLEGLSHAAIGARMGISPRSVENHVANALLHLRAASRDHHGG